MLSSAERTIVKRVGLLIPMTKRSHRVDDYSAVLLEFVRGKRVVHVGFQDPPKLAKDANARADEEAMPHYRRVRDQIRAWVQTLPQSLSSKT